MKTIERWLGEMPVRLRIYSCLQDMYERYSSPAEEIEFEKKRYVFKGYRRKFDHFIHMYHCAAEQHYIVVYTKSNLPVLIKPFYSVDDVQIAEL